MHRMGVADPSIICQRAAKRRQTTSSGVALKTEL
jgi:hypothetical protein